MIEVGEVGLNGSHKNKKSRELVLSKKTNGGLGYGV